MDLPKDAVLQIALELNDTVIFSLCQTNKKFNEYVCENPFFWMNRIRNRFPDIDFSKYGNDYKKIYKFLATPIILSVNIEKANENAIIPLYIRNFPGEKIQQIIYEVMKNFFEQMDLFGSFTISINGKYGGRYKVDDVKLKDFRQIGFKTTKIEVDFSSKVYNPQDYFYQIGLEEAFFDLPQDLRL